MTNKDRMPTVETYTLRGAPAAEAAEQMATARTGKSAARAAYSRLLVEQSKSFGAYVNEKIGATLKRAV